MKLGLTISSNGSRFDLDENLITEADKLGFHSLWTSESWGHDAVTPAAWALALTKNIKVGTGIIQMTTRTPTMVAMTAITLAHLSGDRFILGLGPSGPQVVEGWHGVPYGKPLTRLREYVQIIKQILERKKPLEFEGEHYQFPFRGDGSTGLGIPLKSILHGNSGMQIVTGAISPAGVSAAASLVDGFIPIDEDSSFIKERKKIAGNGFVDLTIKISSKGDIYKKPIINARGLPVIEKEEFMDSTLSIWNILPARAKKIGHPAPFPEELVERFINLYSYKNEIILDPFFGSGTTGLAAKNLERDYIGYEVNSDYCDLAKKRINSR